MSQTKGLCQNKQLAVFFTTLFRIWGRGGGTTLQMPLTVKIGNELDRYRICEKKSASQGEMLRKKICKSIHIKTGMPAD